MTIGRLLSSMCRHVRRTSSLCLRSFLLLLLPAALYSQYRLLRGFLGRASSASISLSASSPSPSSSLINVTTISSSLSPSLPPSSISTLFLPVTAQNSSQPLPAQRRWAYAFLLAGCSDENPGYRGFLAGIVVAARRFQTLGSKADVLVMVQMSTSTPDRRLPPDEEHLLRTMNVRIQYLPKMRSSIHESFYATVQEKFRILTLIEYSRIIFMDADLMPRCNLDYLFELSEPEQHEEEEANWAHQTQPPPPPPLLKQTLILSWQQEAANAGFFMMTPNLDDWQSLQRAVRRKEERALRLPWPHWEEDVGWGHRIVPPDYWRGSNGTKLTKWNWFSVHSDQGLLYYWPKYVKRNVSIVIGHDLETWSSSSSSSGNEQEVVLEGIRSHSLEKFSCKNGQIPPPYRDFHHFTGVNKPWENNLLFDVSPTEATLQPVKRLSQHLLDWNDALQEVQTIANYTFLLPLNDSQSASGNTRPPLGRFATHRDMIRHIKARAFFGWNHYEKDTKLKNVSRQCVSVSTTDPKLCMTANHS